MEKRKEARARGCEDAGDREERGGIEQRRNEKEEAILQGQPSPKRFLLLYALLPRRNNRID